MEIKLVVEVDSKNLWACKSEILQCINAGNEYGLCNVKFKKWDDKP